MAETKKTGDKKSKDALDRKFDELFRSMSFDVSEGSEQSKDADASDSVFFTVVRYCDENIVIDRSGCFSVIYGDKVISIDMSKAEFYRGNEFRKGENICIIASKKATGYTAHAVVPERFYDMFSHIDEIRTKLIKMIRFNNLPEKTKELIIEINKGEFYPVSRESKMKLDVDDLLGGVAAGNAVAELRQGDGVFGSHPLVPGPVAEPVDGDPAGELGKVGRQHRWPVWRHGLPGGHIGVVDAFPAVFQVGENVVGDFG